MRALLLPVVLSLAMASTAMAQDESALAEALFDAGREAAEAGDHATACEKFRESHRLEPGVGTLLNIGECAEKTGEILAAWQAFNEALKLLEGTDKRVPFAKKRFEELDGKIGKLSITLEEGAPDSTIVRRDGALLKAGSFGVFLPVAPASEVALVVSADGFEDRSYRVTLSQGERRELAVRPGDALPLPAPPPPAPVPTPAAPAPAPEPPTPERPEEDALSAGDVLGWSAIALGGVGLITGVGLTIDLAKRRSDLDASCEGDVCRSQAEGDVKAFNDRRVAATASYVAGGVFVAAGIVLLVAWPEDDPDTAFAPVIGPGFAGLSAHGRF